MNKALVISGFAAAALMASSIDAQTAAEPRAPRFADYPEAPATAKFTPAKNVTLGSDSMAHLYRTQLLEGFNRPANFAQKYVVITSGCGTSCQINWIVNKENGQVRHIQTVAGLEYHLNSRLLIADPTPTEAGDKPLYDMMGISQRYFVLQDDQLKNLKVNNLKPN